MDHSIVLRYIQIFTASLSFVGSTIISTILLRSPDGLSVPYRRLIFGLSISDILQSLGFIFGPFLLPRGPSYFDLVNKQVSRNWAFGNDQTCEAIGVAIHVGGNGTMFYTFILCVYYLCKVKYNMSDQQFREKIELKAHITIALFMVCVAVVLVVTDSINPLGAGTFCTTFPSPVGCELQPEKFGECTRGGNYLIYGTAFVTIPGFLSFIGICLSLSLICHKVVKEESQMERRHRSNLTPPSQSSITQTDVQVKSTWRISRMFKFSRSGGRAPLTAGERLVKSSRREIFLQALLYVLVCVIVTIWTYIYGIFRAIGGKNFPYVLSAAFYVFYPLGGALNILVYTRPKILLIRRRHPDYTWLRAFWLVMTAGGQLPIISDNEPRDHDSLGSMDDETDLNLLQFICCRKRTIRSGSASDLEQNSPNMLSSTSTSRPIPRPASVDGISGISSINNSTGNEISRYEKHDDDQFDEGKSAKAIKSPLSQKSSLVSYASEGESRGNISSLLSRETLDSSFTTNP
mmetsp:Transcript_21433/g.31531  ORF Transcript_21433/g.31531 Transcript_21433/m.31531 type:complete len:518 (-) Transcript_21433:102-1655(-)